MYNLKNTKDQKEDIFTPAIPSINGPCHGIRKRFQSWKFCKEEERTRIP